MLHHRGRIGIVGIIEEVDRLAFVDDIEMHRLARAAPLIGQPAAQAAGGNGQVGTGCICGFFHGFTVQVRRRRAIRRHGDAFAGGHRQDMDGNIRFLAKGLQAF